MLDEVIAYAPKGAIADTVFNEGLAIYFRDIALLDDIISRQTEQKIATRTPGAYRQPGWNDIASYPTSDWEFARWFTDADYANRPPNAAYGWTFYVGDITQKRDAHPNVEWGQGNPYNNRVTAKITGTNDNVKVGCFAVALGQLMAFHQYPSTYNWMPLLKWTIKLSLPLSKKIKKAKAWV